MSELRVCVEEDYLDKWLEVDFHGVCLGDS